MPSKIASRSIIRQPYCFIILLVFFVVLLKESSGRKCYNHQEDTYNEQFNLKSCSINCSVTPFLSPDNSLEAHLQLIEEAQESITIANANFESWLRECNDHDDDCTKGYCTGCDLSYLQNETFPLFPALLNAIHLRSVKVRILTNNYSVPTCQDKATILDWLYVNKAFMRMYKTTSFLHAKFMMIDNGRKVLLSSVNFSHMSFMRNRESGVIISQCNDCEAVELYKSVFEYDWNNADEYTLSNVYTNEQIKFMTNSMRYANLVVTPPSERIPDLTIMSLQTFPNVKISGYVSPDYARETFFEAINKTKESLRVHIYEITDLEMCEQLIKLKNTGINVTLIVSSRVSYPPERNHRKCYQDLTKNGITVISSSRKFSFSHQKYWIIDDKTVHLSTGNWAVSDFPYGKKWKQNTSDRNVNRNFLVIMENTILVNNFFNKVFQHDVSIGEPINNNNN